MKRIIIFGAHPDDCDIYAGGTSALWRERGDEVLFVCVTNGDAGHFSMTSEDLATRRLAESKAAAAIMDVDLRVLDHHDGCLEANLETRRELVRLIREFRPDLILTHRPNDYHPDHRYCAILVQDCAYVVTVPLFCPETPHLDRNPVIAYLWDDFRKPLAFEADVAIDVDRVMDRKWDMLHCHASQFYEWLPYNMGNADQVPEDDGERRRWLEERWGDELRRPTTTCAAALEKTYGAERAAGVEYCEAFEICEFGRQIDDKELRELFPV